MSCCGGEWRYLLAATSAYGIAYTVGPPVTRRCPLPRCVVCLRFILDGTANVSHSPVCSSQAMPPVTVDNTLFSDVLGGPRRWQFRENLMKVNSQTLTLPPPPKHYCIGVASPPSQRDSDRESSCFTMKRDIQPAVRTCHVKRRTKCVKVVEKALVLRDWLSGPRLFFWVILCETA